MAKLVSFNIYEVDGGIHVSTVSVVKDLGEAKDLVDAMRGGAQPAEAAPAAPAKPAKKPGKKPKPAPEPELEETEEEEEETEEEEEDEETEEESEEEETKPAKPAKGGGTAVKLTPALKNAGKLREVLTELIENQGIRSKKVLLKTCVQLKDKVPALSKIADLEARVPKAAELIDASLKD